MTSGFSTVTSNAITSPGAESTSTRRTKTSRKMSSGAPLPATSASGNCSKYTSLAAGCRGKCLETPWKVCRSTWNPGGATSRTLDPLKSITATSQRIESVFIAPAAKLLAKPTSAPELLESCPEASRVRSMPKAPGPLTPNAVSKLSGAKVPRLLCSWTSQTLRSAAYGGLGTVKFATYSVTRSLMTVSKKTPLSTAWYNLPSHLGSP
mmetsp:Transcript_15843/g.55137  ORF Transcript_15843/g.55137 Transcript_15843/m.55137 type:complete len:208 (+) Transcript_15843:447-1070(+)